MGVGERLPSRPLSLSHREGQRGRIRGVDGGACELTFAAECRESKLRWQDQRRLRYPLDIDSLAELDAN